MGPEQSMQIQANLGSTIAMVFDECMENPAEYNYAKNSCDRTVRWLKRCKRGNGPFETKRAGRKSASAFVGYQSGVLL